jgi:hypothetical protein
MTESAITKKIQLAMQEIGVTLWRNNVGAYRVDGRLIRYGLAVGSSDLHGIDWQGTTVCVEVKTERGKLRKRQEIWRNFINQHNGIAIVARSADEAVREYRRLKAQRTCGDPATIRPMFRGNRAAHLGLAAGAAETEDQP